MNPKILIVTGFYLPGAKGGGPIRAIKNLVEALHAQFDFFIVTADRDLGDESPYPSVRHNEWIHEGDIHIYYISAQQLSFSKIQEFLKERDYQAVYLNSFFSWAFSIKWTWMLRWNGNAVRLVIDPRGEFSKGAYRIKRWKKQVFVYIAKLLGLYRHAVFQATTPIECLDICNVMGETMNIMEAHDIPDSLPPFSRFVSKNAGSLDMVFIARISPVKNLPYIIEILKEVKGNVQLAIWGPKEDKTSWHQCQRAIQDLPASVKVSYKGVLPHREVVHVLQKHQLYVLPTYGENFGYSIVEALSAGTPVLISDQTPWRGLREQQAGADISLEDRNAWVRFLQEFVDMDEACYKKYERGAYAYARKLVDHKKIVEEYEHLFLG